jgi:hypothetical protein
MTARPYLLVVAPCAPPQNAAEAIQVRRIVSALDTHATGRLVTMQPDNRSKWSEGDATLALALQHFDTQWLSLPLHRVTKRLLMSHRLRWFHRPDAFFWMAWMAPRVMRTLRQKPDVIYSRSYPMSGAMLALKLANQLHVPWIMHLSDPWVDSPYGTPHAGDAAREAACFARADAITLTTQGQVAHYQKKYPEYAAKISLCPNVMPELSEVTRWQAEPVTKPSDDCLHIVFAGNLYGARSLAPMLSAIAQIRAQRPELLSRLRVDVYGNAQEQSQLYAEPEIVRYHGAVSFAASCAAQVAADMVLSIEPDLPHPLGHCFMPSKVLESVALSKPLLAITPKGSETQALCEEGYGWAVPASDPAALAHCIIARIEEVHTLRAMPAKTPPVRYQASHAVAQLMASVHQLMAARAR